MGKVFGNIRYLNISSETQKQKAVVLTGFKRERELVEKYRWVSDLLIKF